MTHKTFQCGGQSALDRIGNMGWRMDLGCIVSGVCYDISLTTDYNEKIIGVGIIFLLQFRPTQWKDSFSWLFSVALELWADELECRIWKWVFKSAEGTPYVIVVCIEMESGSTKWNKGFSTLITPCWKGSFIQRCLQLRGIIESLHIQGLVSLPECW